MPDPLPRDLPPETCARLQISYARPQTSLAMTEALVALAVSRGLAGVGVFPAFAAVAARAAAGKVSVVASVGGLGLAKPTIKAIEATSAIKDGASEVQIAPLRAPLLAGDWEAARHELLEVVRACRATGRDVLIHALIHSAELMLHAGEGAVESACRAVRQGACDGLIDAGDDASHAVVRTHAAGLLLRRRVMCTVGAADTLTGALRPGVDRVDLVVDAAGLESTADA